MTTQAPPKPDSWGPGGLPDELIDRKGGLVGKPISRVDGSLKVRGDARFAAEIALDGMVFAALKYSTIAKGKIASIDTEAAEAAPGVVLVMTYKNSPPMKPSPLFMSDAKAAGGDDLPIMQDARVHWNGQPVAVVLAQTQEQADHAKTLIEIDYSEEEATTSFERAKANGTRVGSFAGEELKVETGDAEAMLAAAPHKVDNVYRTPRHNHNAIEPHAATLAWNGDHLIVHDCVQGVVHVAWSLATIFGIPEDHVHVIAPFVGGGFGGKTLWQHQILAAAASRVAGRPVRVALSREGVYRVVGGRTATEQRVAIGAQNDGSFDALVHTGYSALTEHNSLPEAVITPAQIVYAARSFDLEVRTATMDMLANTFMRAPGESVGTFGLECAVDELAHAMGMDPIELRLRNEPESDPMSGKPFSSRNLVEAYRAGADRFGWSGRNAKPGARREGEWLVGIGCATATYPYQRMAGGAAELVLTKTGRVRVKIAAHEMGMGTATIHTQIVAERLGVSMDDVQFEYADSTFPGVVLAGGSQQTASIGASIIAAQRALVRELLVAAGPQSKLAGVDPEDVACRNGGLYKIDEPERFETYASLLGAAHREEIAVVGKAPDPSELETWSMHSYGAQFCEVRVNAVTGEPRVSRFLGSFDCGRIMNAKTAASQFRGGIIMGLGLALMEETQFDERSGRIVNPSLAEYHVPVHLDVPEIDVMWTGTADPHAPMGAHGIGEIGITGVGAAVANAVFNATGTRVRSLPITLDKLLSS